MAETKISPKLIELCKWKHIQEVNNRLDQGDTPNSVCTFINKNGFKISTPLIYEYAKLRKKALVDGLNIEHMIGIAGKPLVDTNDPNTKSSMQKLKSEIDALDCLIQAGFRTLQFYSIHHCLRCYWSIFPFLKNELTDGNHGFLTNYGMEQLRAIEQNKYELIMNHLISYIPEDKRGEAVSAIEQIEDEYYQGTEYYEEYLRAKELPESEIQRRLEEVAKNTDEE